MIWHTEEELRYLGPARRKDLWWALIGIPIFVAQLGAEIAILIAAAAGKPLVISGLFDISVEWSEAPAKFFLGLIFHSVLIAALLFMLWGCALQIQHWHYHRRR